GSAYLVGANAMGAAAHEMESLVEDIVQGDLDADSGTVMQLQTRLDQLQAIHDGTGSVQPPTEAADDDTYYDAADIAQLQQPWAPPAAPPVAVAEDAGTADPSTEQPPPAPLLPDASTSAAPATDDIRPTAAGSEGESGWDSRVLWQPPREDDSQLGLKREVARVPVPDLESLLNKAGEISVLRARLDEQNTGIAHQLEEVVETVNRLRDQLRQLDGETEAQIEARGLQGGASEAVPDRYGKDFDPLEMDRYSRMQELSRALAETVGDIDVLQESMRASSGEAEALLLQQQRINSDLQQGLMGTLMVPFARQTQRLQRVVRQTAQDSEKEVRAHFEGEAIEVDRNVLERMTAPLEHTLRNAVVHGIEAPALRTQRGKPTTGTVSVKLSREGQQLRLEIADDGGGLDFEAIRRAAVDRGLMGAQAQLTQRQLALFILEPGFSTAPKLTQTAGRGVGMDVVAAEVRQLGGSLEIESEPEQGTRFIIRLPITLGLTQALMFEAGGETFAVPLTNIEGIARVSRSQALPADGSEGVMQYGDTEYRVGFAADFLGLPRATDSDARALPVVLLRLPEGVTEGSRHLALVMDHIIGNREVVSKTIGPVVAALPGMTGATVLPDGRIVLLLDLLTLVQDRIRRERIREAPTDTVDTQSMTPLVMVVDDSITMRRVAERLLVRNGYEVLLARDGVDAMAQLATARPQVVLLDIEMPRADGFEVASYMRNSDALRAVPIIMITSRSGDKHRERAKAFGVQRYLIKPYQEADLLNEIRSVRAEAEA
ncbi:MAG: response regulator, partial [Algiphilus sp.]|uniref:hybrid sensor histidine kinase/response regulator n=1 Tax=Algiphilus sp. TaxID=1872431 RepID=UPI0032EAA395